MTSDARLYDIAIVGCGPVGALAANLAARAGLNVVVVDRETAPHPLPRAVHLDHEMMRLFQAAGMADAIRPIVRETEGHLHVGADHGVIRYMGTAGRPKPFGWANDYFFFQPELDTRLRDGLSRFETVDLKLGAELLDFSQDAAGVSLDLRFVDRLETISARWMIACDGARSFVRKTLNIALDDLAFEESWLVVDADVTGPVRFPVLHDVPETADLQQLSVMMCDPVRPTTIVPGRGNMRRWEFMVLPGEDATEIMSPSRVSSLLAPYLDGVPHEIVRATTYTFHGLVAERWQEGRVFLAGDAAHQTPPFFGQGMCHGMRDVANLVWKLDLVTRGVAAASLLETYQPERDPHVRRVIFSAVEAGRYICELDPVRAAERDATMRERLGTPGTAADLIPAYGAGVVALGTAGAGERFIQPRVDVDGYTTLLDDVTGSSWRLYTDDVKAAHAAIANVAPISVTVVPVTEISDDGALARWLSDRGVDSVLVRPDSYVFGSARNDCKALLSAAREALRLVEDTTA